MRFLHVKSISFLHGHLVDYPTPVVGYLSSFGSLAGLCLLIQIFTGVLLAAHYTPHTLLAFISIEHIMRDVNDGWLVRYYHSNGASIFFLCIYLHIYHNYSTRADSILWYSGMVIYILVMSAAFMGYIIP